jgi:choline dehydrogenase-like flavoprotein
MLPNDFRLKEQYGRAMDWPIDYETLKPYYEMAEFEIGVSGNAAAQEYPIKESMEEYYGKIMFFRWKKFRRVIWIIRLLTDWQELRFS